MSVLVLRLRGPMQAWGSRSRFTRRETEPLPTRSGIIGLLAAAQGRRRTDPIEDMADLRFAVRLDQAGQLMRDFQTAQTFDGKSMPLSHRYYLSDAAFTAYVAGDPSLVGALAEAIRRPRFPLYLGRRSCPPSQPLFVNVDDGDLDVVIERTPWQASAAHQRRSRHQSEVSLMVQADAVAFPDLAVRRELMDEPISFDPSLRRYGSRAVVEFEVTVPNPSHQPEKAVADDHDPFEVLVCT